MSLKPNLITKEGLTKLAKTLDDLKNNQRPAVIADIAEARSHGDLRENSEYAAAKEKQALIEGKINEIEEIVANAEPFNPESVTNKNEIRFGAKCVLKSIQADEVKNIQIVAPIEADLASGLVAIDAPISKILIGKHVNDEVEIISKGKKQKFRIEKIDY